MNHAIFTQDGIHVHISIFTVIQLNRFWPIHHLRISCVVKESLMLLRLSILSLRGVRSSVSLTCTSRGRRSASPGRLPTVCSGGPPNAARGGTRSGPSGTLPAADWPRSHWYNRSLWRSVAVHWREAASPEKSARQAEREASKEAPETKPTHTPHTPPESASSLPSEGWSTTYLRGEVCVTSSFIWLAYIHLWKRGTLRMSKLPPPRLSRLRWRAGVRVRGGITR